MSSTIARSPILQFTSVASFRAWRQRTFEGKESVGLVATMGALHEGHLSLVRRSLSENDRSVVSIFVNPAQFAPREDLVTYPRTVERDLELLSSLSVGERSLSAVFLPSVHEMYPSGITQDKESQKGTFVEVKGYDQEMEGRSRPTFFRGVATVVTKLFNIIQPTRAYFGQKDIQQALLLRRLCADLHLTHPSAASLHIVPTVRDPSTGLALSSRNAYLSPAEMVHAPTLYAALQEAQRRWYTGATKGECVDAASKLVEMERTALGSERGVAIALDYIEMNDPESLQALGANVSKDMSPTVLLSGAMWVGKARLIDNLILGDVDSILG